MASDPEKVQWPHSSSGSLMDGKDELEEQEEMTSAKDALADALTPVATNQSRVGPILSNAQTKTLVMFLPGDPENPYNWSLGAKLLTVSFAIVTVMNSTTGSSLGFAIVEPLATEWGVTAAAQQVLPTSLYLVGYVVGPVIFGPLSEHYGRRGVMAATFLLYTVFTMGCALAPSFAALVVFRLFAGIGAACPIAVGPGICADVFATPLSRGRAMTVYMATTTFGTCLGPVISGYVTPTSWRWSFWAGLILTAPGWVMIALMRETYGPVLLRRRAEKIRKETGNMSVVAPADLESRTAGHIFTAVIMRPIRMMLFEWLVLFTCLYLSLVYGILYMFLESYPIIFGGVYGFSAAEQGLTFLPIGVGAFLAAGMCLVWDRILANAQARDAPWARREEFRRLPLACAGGFFIALTMFWSGWTAQKSIHWIVPTLSGAAFGIGYVLIFMALLSYLVDAYEIFAASASAATSMSRSLFGAVLPFAARPMYNSLGVPWASSLLGFLSLVMCAVPFGFIIWGDKIRANSKFCQHLIEVKKERASQEERQLDKNRRRAAAEDGRRERPADTDLEKQIAEHQ